MRLSTVALAAVAFVTPAFASPFEHHAVAKRVTSDIAKRDARMSWYDITTGQVACSGWYKPSDHVVAMNSAQFQTWNWCGKKLRISYGGKSVVATVVDECPGCPPGALDLTESLFQTLAGDLGLGLIYTNWELIH